MSPSLGGEDNAWLSDADAAAGTPKRAPSPTCLYGMRPADTFL